MKIESIVARQILDSRGTPTLEVDVQLADGSRGRAAVPTGTSKGRNEAFELRDTALPAFGGMGVRDAIDTIDQIIASALRGHDAADQAAVDSALCALDGTENKQRLGANSILGVSMAVARAAAASARVPLYRHLGGEDAALLPVPLLSVLNGGAHAARGIDLQEVMIAPIGASSFANALWMGAEVYRHLKAVLLRAGHDTTIGDAGGFAPSLRENAQALELVVQAIELAGLRPGEDVVLALDAAASALYDDGTYVLRRTSGKRLSTEQMLDLYSDWLRQWHVVSIEDGLAEQDWDEWELLTIRLRGIQLVGDELFVTNAKLIRQGASSKIANAALIKLNQIGTVSEARAAMIAAHEAGYATVVSHRSGETTDDFIADFAVATAAGQIKAGAPCRGERVAKYNQLLRIEEELGPRARYPRREAFPLRHATPPRTEPESR